MANREFGGKIRPKRTHTLSKPYDRRKSFLNKFTDTVKDILVPSWLSDFMKGKSAAESTQNHFGQEQNGNEIKENEEHDNYLTPEASPSDRRPAQPRPLHPEFSNYHQSTTQSNSTRPNLSNYGNEHLLPSHKVQYHPPEPRFSTPTNSMANDVLLPHTENTDVFPSPLIEKRNYLHLSEAEVDQLRNRLHSTNDTNATTSTHLQQQATDDNELDDEEASGSASVEQEDLIADLDRSEAWNSSYLRGRANNRDGHGKRASFEPSLFGSPFMKNSLLSDSLHESPFYSGKTRYGGAAANRKLRLKVSNPYSASMPYRKQVNAKPVKTNTSAVTSSTAKIILDTLEMMATPLSDAHRIPIANNSLKDSVLQFTPSSLKRRNRQTVAASMFDSNSQKLPSRGPPSVMCNSPSIATIARNRQTLQKSCSEPKKKLAEKTKPIEEDSIQKKNSDKHVEKQSDNRMPTIFKEKESAPKRVMESAPAPKSIPSATVAVSFKDVESSSPFGSSTGGKMKRDKSYKSRGSAVRGDDDEEEEPVELETKFILPVKEMPKFSFGDNLSTSTIKSSESSLPISSLIRPSLNSSTTCTVVTSATITSPNMFTFSSPIINKTPVLSQSSASSLDFKFSSPAKAKDSADTPQQTFQYSSTSNLPKPKFSSPSSTSFKTSPPLKTGSVMEALSGVKKTDDTSSPATSNFSSGFFTAKTLKTSGSVMDVLGGGNKSSINSSSFSASNSSSIFGGLQPASTLKTGSVMDILGKPEIGEDTRQTEEEKDLDDTSTDEDEEETEEKDEDDTLLAKSNEKVFEGCVSDQKSELHSDETSSPITSTTITPQTEPDPFMSKFIKPAGTWECSVCMIQNNPEVTKCEACETPKPTSITKPPSKSLTTTMTTSSKPDELMAKFMKPTGAWECSTCLVENDAETRKCCACETPRPGQTAATLSDAATTVSQKADPLMAKFMKPTGHWECDVCMVQNLPSSYKCEACQTPNPNAAPPPPSSSGSSGTVSLVGAVTSSPPPPSSSSSSLPLSTANPSMASAKGSLDKPLWKCDTCLVSNLPQFYKCIACDTPRIKPAVMATMAAISSGSADVLPKFGSGVVTNSNFKFGSSSDRSASVTSTEGFKFGSSSTSEATGTFKFGTASTTSAETSKSFVFGQSAAPAAVDEKKNSSENSGFKFQSSSVPLATNSTAPFTFGSETNTQPSVEEKTPPKSVFSQPSTLNFSFGGSKEKTSESSTPLFGTSTPLTTGLGAFGTPSKPPKVSSNEDKVPAPAPAIPASTSQGSFFGSAPAKTTGSASIFAVPNNINSATSSLPSKTTLPFGTQSTSLQQQQQQLPKPMFGFADKTDSSKNTEAVSPQSFLFISPNEQPNQSTNKTPFATSSVLKRQRDDETDGPSDAKHSFGTTPAPAANPGGFGGFNFSVVPAAAKTDTSGLNNSFNTPSSGQFQFGSTVTNSTSTSFGGATNMAAATPTTTASGFGSPSFNFATSTSTPKPMSSNTSQQQPFMFGSNPTPFSGGASSENTFGNKGSIFGTTGSSGLFDSKSANKGFGATSAATTATNAPFVFGSNTNSSFNFSAAGSGPSPGGIYQFSGKQAEPSPAINNNANIYQFGQITSTNNAPLGANTSSVALSTGVNFNVKSNFDFSKGVGGDFTVGSSNESSSLNNRKFKKAIRRTKN